MNFVDRGSGPPVVLIPGVQGRWEWMTPAVDALAQRCRVLTFSLADEPTCGGRFDEQHGFDCYVDQVREALDAAGLRQATMCGVSYGGLIASAFAARHPERTSALVLVSALPAGWQPNARVRLYLRAPRLLTPVFLIASLRMYREIAAANDNTVRRLTAAGAHAWRAATHIFSPTRMARRVRLVAALDLRQELARAAPPVLIVTGDPALDRVVPVTATHEYLTLFPHASTATIARTGHLGLITRPDIFTEIVATFAERVTAAGTRARVG